MRWTVCSLDGVRRSNLEISNVDEHFKDNDIAEACGLDLTISVAGNFGFGIMNLPASKDNRLFALAKVVQVR